MYELKVKNGKYTADNWVVLWWVVFRHRLSHFCKGEGFAD